MKNLKTNITRGKFLILDSFLHHLLFNFFRSSCARSKEKIIRFPFFCSLKLTIFSIFDTIEKVDPKLVCASATLVARTLSALGRNVNPGIYSFFFIPFFPNFLKTYHFIETDPELLKINANCSLVNELLDCFGRNTSCALRRQFHPFLASM